MSTDDFTAAAGKPYKTLDELALEGLQMYARKRIEQGRSKEHEMFFKKPLEVPTRLPNDLGENAKNTAALWAILGTDAKDDKYVGHSGPVGIAHLMTGGMQDGHVAELTPFLPWALYNTRGDERERILCEALKHEDTLETIDPILPALFHEMVYPSPARKGEPAPLTSSEFIRVAWAASRHEVLHPVIDQFLPAALERELAWCPQNAASLALGRYQDFGDMSPVFPLVKEMLAKCADDPKQLANESCISLIGEVQGSGNKEMVELLRGYSGHIFPRDQNATFLDATECMLVRVNPSGTVDAVSRNADHGIGHIHISNGTIVFSQAASATFEDYPALYEALRDMSKMHFRHIAAPAEKAAKAVRGVINTDSHFYRAMPQAYQAQHPQPGGRG